MVTSSGFSSGPNPKISLKRQRNSMTHKYLEQSRKSISRNMSKPAPIRTIIN